MASYFSPADSAMIRTPVPNVELVFPKTLYCITLYLGYRGNNNQPEVCALMIESGNIAGGRRNFTREDVTYRPKLTWEGWLPQQIFKPLMTVLESNGIVPNGGMYRPKGVPETQHNPDHQKLCEVPIRLFPAMKAVVESRIRAEMFTYVPEEDATAMIHRLTVPILNECISSPTELVAPWLSSSNRAPSPPSTQVVYVVQPSSHSNPKSPRRTGFQMLKKNLSQGTMGGGASIQTNRSGPLNDAVVITSGQSSRLSNGSPKSQMTPLLPRIPVEKCRAESPTHTGSTSSSPHTPNDGSPKTSAGTSPTVSPGTSVETRIIP